MVKKLCLTFFLLGIFPAVLFAQDTLNKADSIIVQALGYRDLYGKYIREYGAQVYIKGNTQVKKKNFLFKYAPDFLYLDKKGHDSFVEAFVDVHFNAPNHFTQEIKAVNGDRLHAEDIRDRLMQFLNVNIYNPTLFNDQILLPGVKEVFRYYRFDYVRTMDTLQHSIHVVRITPKIHSQKLISGLFYIVDDIWTIYRIDINGKWEVFDFHIDTEFGLQHKDFLLPVSSSVSFRFNMLGNRTENHYFSQFQYDTVKLYAWNERYKPVRYDLSNYFNVQIDTLPILKDSLFWRANRPVPLSPYEQSLLRNRRKYRVQDDSLALKQLSWNFSKGLVMPKNFGSHNTQLSYSGLLNPLKLAYTKLDGIMYWQQLKFRKYYPDGKELHFRPNLGILFEKKEVYFNTPASYLFIPEKFGEISFTFGNQNFAYNSTVIDQINNIMPDSIDFKDFNLKYYHHYRAGLQARYEIANGLLVFGGVGYDWYIPVKDKNRPDMRSIPIARDRNDEDVIDQINSQYRIFAPVIGLQWTPQQFYRINGKRKEYLQSRFPTFLLQYSRGSKFLYSNSSYERLEMDVRQRIPLGLTRSFQYYVGGGAFGTNKSIYFADFNNFQRQKIPSSWSEPIDGTFHLLNGDWYNAANLYAQIHLVYESPFPLLRFFRNIPADIVNERFYFSQLYSPVLPLYNEIGYEIGNFWGNTGVFVAFNRGKYQSAGVRFAFDLGQ